MCMSRENGNVNVMVEKGEGCMVLDWKENRDFALQNGIKVNTVVFGSTPEILLEASSGIFENCTFRNFHQLHINDICVKGCTFEDCGTIYVDEGLISGCTFRRVSDIVVTSCDIRESHFVELRGKTEQIIALEDGEISHCTFDDIELRNGTYLCDAVGDVSVEHCNFTNCRTDREDRELFHCEEIRGKIFKRKKEFDIVDDGTCTGLDTMRVIGEG